MKCIYFLSKKFNILNFFSSIIAPMITQYDKLFSNFWGAISEDGFYSRSLDYIKIVERNRIGIWNVPFINSIMLISLEKLQQKSFLSAFSYNLNLDADMSFAHFCRDNVIFIFYIT